MKTAATILLLIAAFARAYAASNGFLTLKPEDDQDVIDEMTPEEKAKLKALKKDAADRLDKANLLAYSTGVLAAILALWQL